MSFVHIGHPKNIVHTYPLWQKDDHDLSHGPRCFCCPETKIVDQADGLSAAGVLIIHREIKRA